MKPIKLSEEMQIELFQKFFEKFKEEINNIAFNTDSASINIKTNISEVAKEKVRIIYTQEAFLRMQALVDFFDTEVAWYGLVERLSEKEFRVYDVKMCKQYVNGAKVDTEDEDALEFFNNLTDNEAEHLHFQAHSHVKMSTGASGVDIQNQTDTVKNMGNSGFFIFQIWNKSGDINTYLYDLDNNVFYDRKDVVIEIEDALGTIDDFLVSIADLVKEKKTYPYQTWNSPNWNNQSSEKDTKKKKDNKKEKEYEPYYSGYYENQMNWADERWDW